MNKEIKLRNDIYSVGVIDNRPVPFHRLILEKGTTYNSYLLKTKKPTVIDTVDLIYTKDFLNAIIEIVILILNDYIVMRKMYCRYVCSKFQVKEGEKKCQK